MTVQAETNINAYRAEAVAAQERLVVAQSDADKALQAFIDRGGDPYEVVPKPKDEDKPKAKSKPKKSEDKPAEEAESEAPAEESEAVAPDEGAVSDAPTESKTAKNKKDK